MYPKNPSRRNVLKTVAASGALLGIGTGAGPSATGTATAQSAGSETHLLIYGNSTPTEYSFRLVDATVEKTTDPGETGINPDLVTINPTDRFVETGYPDGIGVVGRTTNQADAYRITSDSREDWHRYMSFPRTSEDDALVFVNGKLESPNNFLGNYVLFYGDGTPGTYEFTATGSVEKVTYGMGGPVDPSVITINTSDTITETADGTVVSGRTTNQADAYTYDGEITSIRADPAMTVYFPPAANVVVRQTPCSSGGGVEIANLSDQWVSIDLEDMRRVLGEDTWEGRFFYFLRPGGTDSYRNLDYWGDPSGTYSVGAAVVPDPKFLFVLESYGAWPYEYYAPGEGSPALVNGKLDWNTVTLTGC